MWRAENSFIKFVLFLFLLYVFVCILMNLELIK
jgi:hypothetical protein